MRSASSPTPRTIPASSTSPIWLWATTSSERVGDDENSTALGHREITGPGCAVQITAWYALDDGEAGIG